MSTPPVSPPAVSPYRSLFVPTALFLASISVVVGFALQMLMSDEALKHMGMVREEFWHIAIAVALGIVAGVLFVGLLALRLRKLARLMAEYRAGDFAHPPELRREARWADELGQLAATLDDMSQRMSAQLGRLQRIDDERREFIANISHDLRTPIASMRGYLDTLLIQDETLTSQQRLTYLGVAVEQCVRVSDLVQDLFEIAKLEAPNASITAEPCACGELIQDVAQKFEVKARAADIQLQTDIALNLPLVELDLRLMERVLSNLVDNALRHTPRGGRVSLSIARLEGRLRVEVSDTGEGIPEAEQARIFDRYARGHQARAYAGAGLGLAIVRRVLELHGSAIHVRSRPGDGATFYFDLPLPDTAQPRL